MKAVPTTRPRHLFLCLALVLIGLPGLWPAGPSGEARAALHDEAPPGEQFSAQPVTEPESLAQPSTLRRGIQFGAGTHGITVKSEPLQTELQKEGTFSDGGGIHIDWLLDSLRLSYVRQLYRPEIPAGLSYENQTLSRLAFDSDQLWAFHGFRPWYPLYLGYGLGYQRREITLTTTGSEIIQFSESLAMAGLMMDYAFAPPASLQIRFVWEDDGGFVQATGYYLFLSYTVSL